LNHRQLRIARHALASLLLLAVLVSCAGDDTPASVLIADGSLRPIPVNGAELHYLARGGGPAIIFVHGCLADYREWLPVMAGLNDRYTTIAYSRRHSYPNRPNPARPDHSPWTEAEDLAVLIAELRVGPLHVVGTSYGAFTGLCLALQHPELVTSLTVVEPPLVSWLSHIDGGQPVFDDFNNRLVVPVRAAFAAGDREAAFAITLRYFAGPDAMDQIPADVQDSLRTNLSDWEVMFRSSDMLPDVPRASLRNLRVPVLMLSGAATYELGRLVDGELERTLPDVRRSMVPDGTHDACVEYPAVCALEIGAFINSLDP
jgi:pimeloyl-ACP methyl ester carboxylesterase